jgi:hypothetical protein
MTKFHTEIRLVEDGYSQTVEESYLSMYRNAFNSDASQLISMPVR